MSEKMGRYQTRPSSSLDRRDKELRLSGAFRLVASCLIYVGQASAGFPGKDREGWLSFVCITKGEARNRE